MPAIRLDRALTQGEIYDITLGHNQKRSPGRGRAWIILSGHIHFITGTHTALEHQTRPGKTGTYSRLWTSGIDTTVATGEFALFNNYPDSRGSQFQLIIVKGEEEELAFFGDASAYAVIRLLEWKHIE